MPVHTIDHCQAECSCRCDHYHLYLHIVVSCIYIAMPSSKRPSSGSGRKFRYTADHEENEVPREKWPRSRGSVASDTSSEPWSIKSTQPAWGSGAPAKEKPKMCERGKILTPADIYRSEWDNYNTKASLVSSNSTGDTEFRRLQSDLGNQNSITMRAAARAASGTNPTMAHPRVTTGSR